MKRILTNTQPGYAACVKVLKELGAEYENAAAASLGKSVSGRRIYALVLGSGSKKIFFGACLNGLESDMGFMLLRFADELLAAERRGGSICGCSAGRILSDCTLVIAPFLNPDGIELAAYPERAAAVSSEARYFSRRGANARGVDLNCNFGASLPEETKKTACGFIAESTESEPETAALAELCRQVRFERIVNLRAGGACIAVNEGRAEGEYIAAKLLSAVSGLGLTANENENFDGFCAMAANELDTCALSVRLESGGSEYKKLCRLLTYSLIL